MTDTRPRRLRIQGVVINVALVWDDGEELTPGPGLDPVAMPLSKVIEFVGSLPAQVEALAAQYETPEAPRERIIGPVDPNNPHNILCGAPEGEAALLDDLETFDASLTEGSV